VKAIPKDGFEEKKEERKRDNQRTRAARLKGARPDESNTQKRKKEKGGQKGLKSQ